MASTILLLFFMITIVFVAMIYRKLIENDNQKKELTQVDKQKLIEQHIIKIFSFPYIVDSKFIGLIVFLLSNLLTGLINLTMDTLVVSNFYSFLILNAYAFVAYFFPYLAYYYFYFYNKNKKN